MGLVMVLFSDRSRLTQTHTQPHLVRLVEAVVLVFQCVVLRVWELFGWCVTEVHILNHFEVYTSTHLLTFVEANVGNLWVYQLFGWRRVSEVYILNRFQAYTHTPTPTFDKALVEAVVLVIPWVVLRVWQLFLWRCVTKVTILSHFEA